MNALMSSRLSTLRWLHYFFLKRIPSGKVLVLIKKLDLLVLASFPGLDFMCFAQTMMQNDKAAPWE